MRYLDLFAGYGGFSLGIQQAYERLYNSGNNAREPQAERKLSTERKSVAGESGEMSFNSSKPSTMVSCIGFSEIDKYATQVYKQHFKYEECTNCAISRIKNERESEVPSPRDSERQCGEQSDDGAKRFPCNCNHKEYGDITKINAKELPDFDLICGGFPCQAFSIAGKRLGFEDTRGTLIYDVLRIIKEKHPRYVLLENVKGLLSHDSGRTFKTIITSLAELGYAVEWQVLNAKNFGVPQNRERVFIIGHFGGFSGRKVFPIGCDNETSVKLQGQQGITNTLTTRYTATGSGSYIAERKLNAQKIKVVGELNSETWKKKKRIN